MVESAIEKLTLQDVVHEKNSELIIIGEGGSIDPAEVTEQRFIRRFERVDVR